MTGRRERSGVRGKLALLAAGLVMVLCCAGPLLVAGGVLAVGETGGLGSSPGDDVDLGVDGRLAQGASGRLAAAGVELNEAPAVLQAARNAVADGVLGYALLIAERTDRPHSVI